ncbi:polysaccharide deacetylase family protein [Amycolatopsis echigonensis]|uniref:Polysaccharide deacetylase n=1 Tax=Amycolatopsis echigonensis TaxID=2576905 RepID=A0A2N3WN19_9PSEU|nr:MULTISPECIES: polysaccharide deacetylase [Amycolatopsis]MBB2506271.1 polysaccharide deacetylase [Amycolatopsis echigonensis]PKV95270.1 polysaccharide deacetylase [Amycolatopsis niigatensis]
MGHLQLPPGKKIAVNLGTDFDAQSLWLGGFNRPSPSFMSRGQFGAEVGVPRLLELYKRFDVTTTWFVPGHSVDTFPEQCKDVVEAGHEIGHHGYYHEIPPGISRDTERRLVDLAFATYKNVLGLRPTGYRSPYWDYSENTLDIIEESGFRYDTSLMARDLVPHHPQRWQINWEKGNVAGPASSVLEIPVNWYLDDFPPLGYTGTSTGMQDTETIFRRWRDIFDYAYERVPNSVFASCVHPQIIGQAHNMLWYERLIEHIVARDGVWFATCDEIAQAWVDDEEDERLKALPDVRGVEPAPADSSWARQG